MSDTKKSGYSFEAWMMFESYIGGQHGRGTNVGKNGQTQTEPYYSSYDYDDFYGTREEAETAARSWLAKAEPASLEPYSVEGMSVYIEYIEVTIYKNEYDEEIDDYNVEYVSDFNNITDELMKMYKDEIRVNYLR